MGVSLRDRKQAPAASSEQKPLEPPRRRVRVAWLVVGVSVLIALLAGGGALLFTRQTPAPAPTTITKTPTVTSVGPISAFAGGHLMLDGANGWTDVTPAHLSGNDPTDGQFLTPTLGWVVDVQVSGKTTKDFVVYSTTDGGGAWKSVTVPWQDEGEATAVWIRFVDARHGFVSVALHPQTSRRSGFLYATSDGGATWTKHELPFGGPVAFSSPTTGIVIGGGIDTSHNLIDITRDGGATWNDEPVIAPAGFELVDRYLSAPAFDGQQGIMAVNYGTEAAFYTSDDGGVTWLASSSTDPVAFADREMQPVVSLFGKAWLCDGRLGLLRHIGWRQDLGPGPCEPQSGQRPGAGRHGAVHRLGRRRRWRAAGHDRRRRDLDGGEVLAVLGLSIGQAVPGAQALLDAVHRVVEPRLADAQRQVAARLLDDAAHGVRRAAQVAGDRVREIEGDEQPVDVVHIVQQRIQAVELADTHAVQHVAAQFPARLAQPIEIRRPLDPQLVRRGQRLALNQRAGEGGLGVLLLRVGDEAGVEDVEMLPQVNRHITEQAASLGNLAICLLEFVAVRCADGIGAKPNGGARLG